MTDLLPGLVLFGAGITGVGVPAQVVAAAEVSHDDAGAVSGVVNTGYQVGGALGLAVISTLSTSEVTAKLGGRRLDRRRAHRRLPARAPCSPRSWRR